MRKCFKPKKAIKISFIALVAIFVFFNFIDFKDNQTRFLAIESFKIKNDFKRFVSILYENDGFLIDNKYFSTLANKTKIIAGIFQKKFKKFNEELILSFGFCNFYFELGSNYHQKIFTSFFTGILLDCYSYSIQISVFYVQNNFYWIGYANKNFQFFGDKDRALNL